jgi:hypothetical protein
VVIGDYALDQRQGIGGAALLLVEESQVIDRLRDIGVVGAERFVE